MQMVLQRAAIPAQCNTCCKLVSPEFGWWFEGLERKHHSRLGGAHEKNSLRRYFSPRLRRDSDGFVRREPLSEALLHAPDTVDVGRFEERDA